MSVAALPPSSAPFRMSARTAYDIALWVLFLGPIASPLFRIGDLPLLAPTGELARTLLATYICPTPDRSLLLFGYPMGVCVRCWGATIGLWGARLVLGRDIALLAAYRRLDWRLRLLIAAVPFLLWPLEIVGQSAGYWFAPLWLLLLNGLQAGFAAGLFFSSVWPQVWPDARRV